MAEKVTRKLFKVRRIDSNGSHSTTLSTDTNNDMALTVKCTYHRVTAMHVKGWADMYSVGLGVFTCV